MVGQNLLLELIEGDKVQLYVYTGAGISDHKNSHYTQFIGCLLRPSVETLASVMRRLGSSDAMEDDVSTADDISMRGKGINGDASLMGRSRRGGSKSRVLSPPPQPPANQNSASTSDVTNEVIKEEIEPPSPSQLPIENGVQNGHSHEKNDPKADQKSQSYLALTKLGMGSNKNKQPVEENNNKKESPKEGKKSKEINGKDSSSKKKSMAEMATSTLKGFTKM